MLEGLNRRGVLERLDVSRDTTSKLDAFVELLMRWRRVTDLMSEASLDSVWTRHIEDSAQLLTICPAAKRWLDLGAGAGFPGLIIAILLGNDALAHVDLVESDKRKCAFLSAAIAATGARAFVHHVRIEKLEANIIHSVDSVTARAVAPLPKVVELSKPWLKDGSVGLFPRGKGGEAEFLSYLPQSEFAIDRIMSRTDPDGLILRVHSAAASPKRTFQRNDP